MSINARGFLSSDASDLVALLSRNAAARAGRHVYLMGSDVAWRLPDSAPEQNLRVWYDGLGLAGFVWFDPPTDIEFDVRAGLEGDASLSVMMLSWGESRRRACGAAYPRFVDLTSMAEWAAEIARPRSPVTDGTWLTALAFDDDVQRVALLTANGFAATGHVAVDYHRDLSQPIPDFDLGDGWRTRHVTVADFAERIACHRAAWVGSSFDLARYRQIRAFADYTPELDIVLETSDGSFASYCICWIDRHAGIGSFEPVGARPEWRGRGAARAIVLEGLRRLRQFGMRWARVSTPGFNAPAQALYESCGFERTGTCRTFIKKLAVA